jgi:hypothetical protein
MHPLQEMTGRMGYISKESYLSDRIWYTQMHVFSHCICLFIYSCSVSFNKTVNRCHSPDTPLIDKKKEMKRERCIEADDVDDTQLCKVAKQEEIQCWECFLTSEEMTQCDHCPTQNDDVFYCGECMEQCDYCDTKMCKQHSTQSTQDDEEFLCPDCVQEKTCGFCDRLQSDDDNLHSTCCNRNICANCVGGQESWCAYCQTTLCKKCESTAIDVACCDGPMCGNCSDHYFTCTVCKSNICDKCEKPVHCMFCEEDMCAECECEDCQEEFIQAVHNKLKQCRTFYDINIFTSN